MNKKIILPLLVISLLLGGCGAKTTGTATPTKTNNLSTKLLINELPFAQRPFTVLVPHTTNRLFTFVTIGADKAKAGGLDLEYQSGDLLKGAKADLVSPITSPYVKAIILGSCSTGGKCSFDKDLKSGTMKLKLMFAGQDVTHVLKGDFTFVTGQNNLPDGRFAFAPSKTNLKDNLVLLNSLGLPKTFDKEVVLYPVVISATSNKVIAGTLTIKSTDAKAAYLYDGQNYQTLKTTTQTDGLTIAINNTPWSMPANITRDDEKGSQESLNLYLLGPIVLTK